MQLTIQRSSDFAYVIHIYHLEIVEELIDRFSRFTKIARFDILITTDTNAKAIEIARKFAPIPVKPFIFIHPNLGRDILAFLSLASTTILNKYSFIIKLHTKLTSSEGNRGSRWRTDLFDFFISEPTVLNCFSVSSSNTGIIVPSTFNIPLHRYMGKNFLKLYGLCKMKDIDLNSYLASATFPAGSMFACSSAFTQSIASRQLHLLPFEQEPIGDDGYWPHVVERFFGIHSFHQGLKTLVIGDTPMNREFKYLEFYESDQPDIH
jgi:lipopolysaccharide biosynthesis protein